MNTTLKLTLYSIKMFIRNRQALFFTLIMPLFIMIIFGFIGFDKPAKVDVGLVTHTPNAATAQFIEAIKQFPTFTIHEGTLADEEARLNSGDLAVVLDVPDDVLPPTQGLQKQISMYTNEGKVGESQAVGPILNDMINRMTLSGANLTAPISINSVPVGSHNLRYIEFLLPGLIALSIMQMSVFSVAFVFTQSKRRVC